MPCDQHLGLVCYKHIAHSFDTFATVVAVRQEDPDSSINFLMMTEAIRNGTTTFNEISIRMFLADTAGDKSIEGKCASTFQ